MPTERGGDPAPAQLEKHRHTRDAGHDRLDNHAAGCGIKVGEHRNASPSRRPARPGRTTWIWGRLHDITSDGNLAVPRTRRDLSVNRAALRYAGIPDVHKELRGRPDRPADTARPAALALDAGRAAGVGSPTGPAPGTAAG